MNSTILKKVLILIAFTFSINVYSSGKHDKHSMQGGCENYKIDVSKELSLLKKPAENFESLKKITSKTNFTNLSGKRILLELNSSKVVKNFIKPEKVFHSKEEAFSGLLPLKVLKNGTYQISGNGKFWFDLIDFSKKTHIKSLSFDMQTKCKGLFKVVSFKLDKSKTYLLQVSSSLEKSVQVMINKTL